jgi:Putative DNA-binding domain
LTSLAGLQRAFQRQVLERRAHVAAELAGAERGDLPARLGAYVEGYRGRLVEALGVPYSALRLIMGADEFDELAREYIERTPSRHYNIRYYGADLAALVARRRADPEGATLAELARWEWLLAEVFDAVDDEPLAMEALAATEPADWPSVRFSPRASLRRILLSTNAVEWWRYANELAPEPAALARVPDTAWMAWRRGVKTFFRSLTPVEAGALDLMVAGASFGELCERLAEAVGPDDAALTAASMLRTWLGEELITSCRIDRRPD